MKMSMRKMLVLLAIVLSFTAVQAVWAQDILTVVDGTIERISKNLESGSIDVASNGAIYTFYDIPFTDLEDVGITLNVGVEVTLIKAYVVILPNGMKKNIAYIITVGSVTYDWHPNVPKAGTKTVTLSATDENGQLCLCKCIEDTECYKCNCYCGANR